MPSYRLVFRTRSKVPPGAPLVLSSANLSRVYFPGWGILLSILFHAFALCGLIFLSLYPGRTLDVYRPQQIKFIYLVKPKTVMLLPSLGGGSEGTGLPGAGSGAPSKGPAHAPGTKGFSYYGPQPILSHVPNPTNTVHTVLQPALKKPPILQPPLPLPNLVQLADTGLAPRFELPKLTPLPPPEVKPVEPRPPKPPEVKPPVSLPVKLIPTTIEVPKLILPAGLPRGTPVPETRPAEPTSRADLDRVVPITRESSPAEPVPPTTLEKPKERDLRDLLSLTPIPSVPEQPVPPGEARGHFAISPEANPAAPETEPGTKFGTLLADAGIAIHDATSGNGAAENDSRTAADAAGSGAGKKTDSRGGGSGTGTSPNSKAGSGSGPGGGTGSGGTSGSGAGSGAGPGSGSGSGVGSGTGAGSGPGRGPFRGITIIGGVTETGAAAKSVSHAPPPRPLQTSYGLSIVSTEDSGGGLPFFGVFEHRQVYTVYLDMRQTVTDPAPSWTLEYAVLQDAQADPPMTPGQAQPGLVLPFPTVKERPAWPAELVRKYPRKMIIVYAVIKTDGTMEQVAIKQSPDPLLNEPILSILGRWVFRPARLNGQPLPAQILMGIPLWVPE